MTQTSSPMGASAPERDGDGGDHGESADIIAAAAARARAGGLVITPTDTVYGIGTTAADATAVARLLGAKGRGRRMPPPVLVAGRDQLDGVVADPSPAALALMDALWPGALTLVLAASPALAWDLGETGGTIAVRMPDHPLTLALLRATGPMAVTSANRTGEPPATDAASARLAFPGQVADAPGALAAEGGRPSILLIDGGPTPGPVPSTIVSLAGDNATRPRVLREGLIPVRRIEEVLEPLLAAQAGPSAAPEPAREGRA
ncbi:L-threonylcarbamoyladenylate synthase [Actinomyces gaoshouyii]|uniref:L-threonylcarbamoyladenylate synthase n=1 Tax=Actinomyces gaoshouyii TaxID=1960083 RepID=UPI001F0B4B61|nr:L-threonylcarbamoyladenylate synthase [Actinomyces gaoshouyii]